jgi:AcrR family transcriptional regulator
MPTTAGRPRDVRLDARIIDAIEAVLVTAGYDAVTIDRVAREAQSTRAAVYRRYDNRSSMVVGLLIDRFGVDPAPDTGELKRDLEELQQLQVRFVSHPVIVAVLAGALSEAGRDPVLAGELHARFMAPRRASVSEMLRRAVERGEVATAVEPEIISDLLTGPLLLHALVPGLGALSDELVAATVASALAVLGAATS